MDEADIAQKNTEILDSAALKAHFARTITPREGRIPGLHPQRVRPSSRECDDCGEQIPRARLQANPAATRCVQCQAKHEQRMAPHE